MSATSYQSVPLNILEERRHHLHRGGSLLSSKCVFMTLHTKIFPLPPHTFLFLILPVQGNSYG